MRSVLVVGLGRFGRHVSKCLMDLKKEVLAVDCNEARVNDAIGYVTAAQIGDATNEQFIESIGVNNFDLCIVAIGDDFQDSLEATLLLKEHGAKFVLARACRDIHAKFLLRNGADDIIYAEKEMAERVAFKYGCENIADFVELTPEYSIYEINVPVRWIGKTIRKVDVRARYNISILATKYRGDLFPLPNPDYEFKAEETLIILGHKEDVLPLVEK